MASFFLLDATGWPLGVGLDEPAIRARVEGGEDYLAGELLIRMLGAQLPSPLTDDVLEAVCDVTVAEVVEVLAASGARGLPADYGRLLDGAANALFRRLPPEPQAGGGMTRPALLFRRADRSAFGCCEATCRTVSVTPWWLDVSASSRMARWKR